MPFMVSGGLTDQTLGADAVLRLCQGFTMSAAGRTAPVYDDDATLAIHAKDYSPPGADAVGMQKTFYLSGTGVENVNASSGGSDLLIIAGETWAVTGVIERLSGAATVIGTLLNAGATISFPSSIVLDNATVGTVVGTATISGIFTGTATWSMPDTAGGQFAINATTGVGTVDGALTDGNQLVEIAVSGIDPPPQPATFVIQVQNPETGQFLQSDGVPFLQSDGVPFLQQ